MDNNAEIPEAISNSCTNSNTFYTSFDKETLDYHGSNGYHTPFELDRDRIIHSYAFRRLQAKTQVFTTGEYDFYRTRLTHTIEVSQVGRSTCAFLNRSTKGLNQGFHIDPSLVEAVCLAHDIGHAPFGHMGEAKLNQLMDEFGGFEGNAQTLRLLAETIWTGPKKGERQGMGPTRALLDGVLKYKTLRSRITTQKKDKFLYDEQEKYLDFVHKGLPPKFLEFQSIECEIMDWADEIAYSTADIVDGAYARFITVQKLADYLTPEKLDALIGKIIKKIGKKSFRGSLSHKPEELDESVKPAVEALLHEVIGRIEKHELQRFRAIKIGELIESVRLVTDTTLKTDQTNRYLFRLKIPEETRAEQLCLAQISRDLVFDSPGLQQLQYKAQELISRLFTVLKSNYLPDQPAKDSVESRMHLLGQDVENTLDAAPTERERARRLCDYISGMSDGYIIRTCRRLTDPEFGSILDLV